MCIYGKLSAICELLGVVVEGCSVGQFPVDISKSYGGGYEESKTLSEITTTGGIF